MKSARSRVSTSDLKPFPREAGSLDRNREQLAQSFGQELTALPGESRERTLNAVAMALTPEGWIVLRERLGLTVEQAREEWRFIVKAIFKETGR